MPNVIAQEPALSAEEMLALAMRGKVTIKTTKRNGIDYPVGAHVAEYSPIDAFTGQRLPKQACLLVAIPITGLTTSMLTIDSARNRASVNCKVRPMDSVSVLVNGTDGSVVSFPLTSGDIRLSLPLSLESTIVDIGPQARANAKPRTRTANATGQVTSEPVSEPTAS